MALDQAVKDTILARFQGGEKLPKIFQELNVEMEDRRAFRQEYKEQIRAKHAADLAANPPLTEDEQIAAMSVEQLDAQIAQIDQRIAKMNERKAKLEASKASRG